MEFRSAQSRGHPASVAQGGYRPLYLDTYRTFSFPGYYDSRYMKFSHLRTLNDDRMNPGYATGWHQHKNMEIFGYVVDGECRHIDSLGHDVIVKAGGVQRMSAGHGIFHEESNPGRVVNRYFQIWLTPAVKDTEPIHEWVQITRENKLNTFFDITTVLPIKQNTHMLCGIFTQKYAIDLDKSRQYYLYGVKGKCTINGRSFGDGDGISFKTYSDKLAIENISIETELLLFDLELEV